jgi:hypothetical protein
MGILASYTLESTFFGSEFFRKQKLGALIPKEDVDYQIERYGISYNRKDISID